MRVPLLNAQQEIEHSKTGLSGGKTTSFATIMSASPERFLKVEGSDGS